MVRVALLFLVMAALAVLVLSNLSPVTLTVLATQTLALPLGAWVVGAIAAGAATTVVMAGLFQLARPAAVPKSARRPRQESANRFNTDSFRAVWPFTDPTRQQSQAPASSSSYNNANPRRATQQETSQSAKAAWDDWSDEPNLADRKSEVRTSVRDTEDDEWANWEGFENLQRPDRQRDDDFDRDADDLQDDRAYDDPPAQTDFEVKREPETRYQSGSVYSFSYRRSDDDQPEPATPTAKPPVKPTTRPGEVYDADYRVITPPYRSDPEEVMRPLDRSTEIRDSRLAENPFEAGQDEDDEDWGLDDELDDRPRM